MIFLEKIFLSKYKYLYFVLVVTAFTFWPVTKGEFLPTLDDSYQVLENPNVTNLSFQSIKNYFTNYVLESYQPLASLSFGIEYFLFKDNPFLYHFNNLLLHLLNTVLVYFVLSKLFKSRNRVALLITTIFAIHPLQTETIGWISTRSSLLSSLFFLVSCYYYILYLEKNTLYIKTLFYAILFFVLALFSKSMAIVLPILLIGFDYLYSRKFTVKAVIDKVAFFALSVVFGIISLYSRKIIGDDNTTAENLLIKSRRIDSYTFIEKITISAHSILFYIKKFLAPIDLYIVYGHPLKISKNQLPLEFSIAPFIITVMLIGFVIVCLKFFKEDKRFLFFGTFFFVITIFPTLNIITTLAHVTSERYMYLAIIGLSIPLILFLEKIKKQKKLTSKINYFYGIVFILFAFKSHSRAKVWKNTDTYLINVFEGHERNDIVESSVGTVINDLGLRYIRKNEFKKAIPCMNRTIKMDKYESRSYVLRGVAYAYMGNDKLALKDFNKVIETPKLRTKKLILAEAFRSKGRIYKKYKDYEKSKIQYDSALYYNPTDVSIRIELNKLKKLSPN